MTRFGSRQRALSVQLTRKYVFEYPDWCPYVDLCLECPCEPLVQHLLTVQKNGKPQWASVRSIDHEIINISGTMVVSKKSLLLKTPFEKGGYWYTYHTLKGGKRRGFSVHRAVWEAFVGEIPKDKTIDHCNRDPSDNHLSNLRLASLEEQMKNRSKPIMYLKEVEISWNGGEWVTFTNVFRGAEEVGMTPNNFRSLLENKTWTKSRKGFTARYKEIDKRFKPDGSPEDWFPLIGTKDWVSSG